MARENTVRKSVGRESADPMIPLPYRVRQVRRETRDTSSLLIEPVSGDGIGSFLPGQFNMLYVYGKGEAAISISADPSKPDALWHTVRRAGFVANGLCDLKRGDMLGVRGPYGEPWPVEEARGHDVLIIAGGIGLAPLRPVIYHVLTHRDDYDGIYIIYGARTPEDLLYRRQLEEWRGRFDTNLDVTVDTATSDWRGEVGVITTILPNAHYNPDDAIAFICGPEIMMRFAARDLEGTGVPDDHIYLSMERHMKCGVGLCGRCQFGPYFVCKDGPVFRYDRIRNLMVMREV